jgi:hypothetical protein
MEILGLLEKEYPVIYKALFAWLGPFFLDKYPAAKRCQVGRRRRRQRRALCPPPAARSPAPHARQQTAGPRRPARCLALAPCCHRRPPARSWTSCLPATLRSCCSGSRTRSTAWSTASASCWRTRCAGGGSGAPGAADSWGGWGLAPGAWRLGPGGGCVVQARRAGYWQALPRPPLPSRAASSLPLPLPHPTTLHPPQPSRTTPSLWSPRGAARRGCRW